MSSDEFTKLFVYMQREFSEINVKLENTASKESVHSIINTLDGFAMHASDTTQEIAMLTHASQRMERWLLQIAGDIGTKLE